MSDEMIITFPGNKRVDAELAGHVIRTDQPAMGGGDGSAATPFATFLASIGTCAGIYVLGFCQMRGIPTDEIRLVQRMTSKPTGQLAAIEIDIQVPESFPEKYHKSLVAAANACAVKKTLFDPPELYVQTVVNG